MSTPAAAPHDRVDLYLAPVALSVDSWLETHSTMSQDRLKVDIVTSTNRDPQHRVDREEAVIAAMAHDIEAHGWELSLAERGVRLSHRDHGLVLGLPANLNAYIGG